MFQTLKTPLKYALISAGFSILISFILQATSMGSADSYQVSNNAIYGILLSILGGAIYVIQIYLVCHMLRALCRKQHSLISTKTAFLNVGIFSALIPILGVVQFLIRPLFERVLGQSPFSMEQEMMNSLSSGGVIGLIIISTLIFSIAIGLISLILASRWLIFKKSGKEGWHSIVPILNLVTLLEIVKRPTWWIALYIIPVVNIVISIIVINLLGQRFGKDNSYTIGLILLPFIFYPLLAFESTPNTDDELDQIGIE